MFVQPHSSLAAKDVKNLNLIEVKLMDWIQTFSFEKQQVRIMDINNGSYFIEKM